MGLVIEDDVAIQMTQIILILVMTTKQLLITMLLVAHQENVSMFNAIVIQKVHHLVLQQAIVQVRLVKSSRSLVQIEVDFEQISNFFRLGGNNLGEIIDDDCGCVEEDCESECTGKNTFITFKIKPETYLI